MAKKSKTPSSDPFDAFNSFSSFDDFDSFDKEAESDVVTEHESLEAEAKAEVTDHMLAIREATKNTQKSLQDQWSTDFYFCAFFADQAQRDEFLQKAGALGLVKDNFINGQKLAELLGIDLTPRTIEKPRLFAPKKDWFDITL
ncbi:hypothetical protein [Parapedobacter indicus]|uniref:Uncharacterized protein n=1 Tax=Parapedobacter indicus TaxID=1477437 RepID=A0A1I3V2D6_9SPHI|nr:hypothetical protein [Parapedobacter indicus]PPK98998.1 hypothetical protein CLV26_11528 [Parapedobacter indicus]SFJ89119.1 hypothetical protein SAMN05444682_115149 [Parapedobacter indicus]